LKLSELSHKFSQNLLDSTNAFEMIIDDFEDVREIPQSDLELAKFDHDGKTKYKFTLQMPSYISYITYGSSRERREEIYKAYCTRAPQNAEIINEILKLKFERSNILGFDNYAQYSISTKMAKNEDDVVSFLEELALKGKDGARKELEEVKKLALEMDKLNDCQNYDLAYYSEKLKKEKYEIDAEFYRPYFEQNSVLNGFFDFLYKIFNIKFVQKEVSAWDDKVKVYDILENDQTISRIYIDLESRKDKRGGAWMNNWHTHYINVDGKELLPTAYIVCNFPPSTSTNPSLLRHDDVVTLFHEMGHALHHLLSKVSEPFVSGISGVAWDVVEFPSQFLEYFAYDKEVLKLFAKHHKTGEVLSDTAIDRLIKAKNFQSSLALVRQVEFALFDFKLYQKLYETQDDVQKLIDEVRDQVSVIKPPKYNKFQNGFAHIFSGGYSAGYYSYKWAEVLSADAFYLFLDTNVFNKDLALKYKNLILGKGGSVDMDKLFYELTNRNPSVDSLLKIDGIIS
ncbi:peptidase M3, partial [Arcobacter sp. 31_11_sub10_T18]